MSILDKLFGRAKVPRKLAQPSPQYRPQYPRPSRPPHPSQSLRPLRQPGPPGRSPAEQALDRYRYMLRTAPLETIEQAHAEAFAKLTSNQRRMLLEQLNANVPANERPAGLGTQDDPMSLARMATRAEIRQRGTLERTFSSINAAPVQGARKGTFSNDSFMNTFTWLFLGGMIAQQFFDNSMYGGFDPGGASGYDADYSGADPEGDFGGGDFGGGDFGGGAT